MLLASLPQHGVAGRDLLRLAVVSADPSMAGDHGEQLGLAGAVSSDEAVRRHVDHLDADIGVVGRERSDAEP